MGGGEASGQVESSKNNEDYNADCSSREVHHADCAVYGSDEKALARQARLEEKWGPVSDSIIYRLDKAADHVESVYSSVKNTIKPEGAHVGPETSYSLGSKGRHKQPAKPNALSQFSGKQAAAGALAFLSAASPSANVLEAVNASPPAVAEIAADLFITQTEAFSPEAIIERYRYTPANVDIQPTSPSNEQVKSESLPKMPLEAVRADADSPVEQPLVRTLFPGQTIRDFADTIAGDMNRQQRASLIKQIASMSGVDLDSGQDHKLEIGYELKIPLETAGLELYTVKKGDTSSNLFNKLGFKEDGYSFEQFLEIQAIADKDSIRTGWKMFRPQDVEGLTVALEDMPAPPPVSPPSPSDEPVPITPKRAETVSSDQPPKPPQPTEDPPEGEQVNAITKLLQAGVPEIGQVEVDNDQISLENGRFMNRDDAELALSLLIEATRDYENPLHDMQVPMIEHQPTPEANRLQADWHDLIDDLVNGEVNLAYLQSEVLRRLAASAGGQIDSQQMQSIADHFVHYIAERNEWTLADEEASTLAGMMVRGATPVDLASASHAQIEAASLAGKVNHSALTIDLYQASLRGHMDEQVELVRLAEQQLELLRSNMRDLSEEEIQAIAQSVVDGSRSGQPANDYSYEVFKAKLGEQANESTVLKLLGRQLYALRGSDDLLDMLPTVETKLTETIEGWLAAEGGKSLSGLLETIDSQLSEQIMSITERGQNLQEQGLDLKELDPDLADLSDEQAFELAKTILSAEENHNRAGDDWYYLIELAAPAGEDISQTLLNLVSGVYRVQGADLLLAKSGNEQLAATEAIDQFLAGPEQNVKAFLDAQFSSLEQRLVGAEAEVSKVIDIVKQVAPGLNDDTIDLPALTVRRLLGQTNQELVDELKKIYKKNTGNQLTDEQTVSIDIGLIRLQTPDKAERLDKFSQRLLEYINQQNANFYLSGVDDPAVRTLALMLESGQHVIDYGDTQMSIFSSDFMDKLRAYDTVPSSLFPGTQWLILGYAGQDLRPFFEHMGLDAEAVLASPYNHRLKTADGKITADSNGAIWFGAELWPDDTVPDFEEAVDWAYGEIPGFPYTVKKGDTYAKIAQMFRVEGNVPNWEEIVEHNRERIPSDPTQLKVGQHIVLPVEWKVYIDFDSSAPIEIDIPDSGGSTKETKTPENIPANAEIKRVDLGSLGNIEIVQLDDTFDTSRKMTPTAVINHWTGGDYNDDKPLENFLNGIAGNKACKGGCSVHFFISEQGGIYQLSDLNSQLAHAKGANSFGVGIEIEGSWGYEGMPSDTVYSAALKLNAYLVQELGLDLDHSLDGKNGILGHYEVDGSHLDPEDSGKTDPGKTFLQKIRSDIDKWARPTTVKVEKASTPSLSLEAEHNRIKDKVSKELSSLPVYENPYGLSPSDINQPELVFTVDEMAQNRLDKDSSGKSWDNYIGPSEGARNVMEALIVYGGLHEIDAPGWTTDELLIAATATHLGEGAGYTHIVGDLKVKDGAELDPTDEIDWSDEIISISTSDKQFYWTEKFDGSFRDPELVGNDHRIAANRAGRMIREELAAGRPILDKWHYYRDWEEEHHDEYLAHAKTAEQVLEDIKAGR